MKTLNRGIWPGPIFSPEGTQRVCNGCADLTRCSSMAPSYGEDTRICARPPIGRNWQVGMLLAVLSVVDPPLAFQQGEHRVP